MNKRKATIAALLLAIGVAGFANYAGAQYTPPTFWKRVGTALLPAITGDTIGSSGTRISAVYATLIDGLSVAIGGAVTGNLTAPSYTATSTSGGGYRFGTNGDVDIGTPALSAGNVYSSGTIRGGSFMASTMATNTFMGPVSTTKLVVHDGTTSAPSIAASGGVSTGINFNGGTGSVYINNNGTRSFTVNQAQIVFDGNGVPGTANTRDLGGLTVFPWRNLYATGTEIVFGGIAANNITDDLVCVSPTGTLRHETSNCTVSSVRFKEHIQSLSPEKMLENTEKLRPVMFDFSNGGHGSLGTATDEGFIAEEVAMVDPYLVVWERVRVDDAGFKKVKKLYPTVPRFIEGRDWYIPKTVSYEKMSVMFAGAIQAMDDRLSRLEAKVSAIK